MSPYSITHTLGDLGQVTGKPQFSSVLDGEGWYQNMSPDTGGYDEDGRHVFYLAREAMLASAA